MKKLIHWVQKLIKIVSNYENDMAKTRQEINNCTNIIRSRTELHIDVHPKSGTPCNIIAIGRYRGRGYVRCFDVHPENLSHLIEILRDLESQYGRVKTVDSWPSFDAVFERGLRHKL